MISRKYVDEDYTINYWLGESEPIKTNACGYFNGKAYKNT